MDHFGIGAAMRGMAEFYFRAARRTGRTTSLIESVKDGDRIVFSSGEEAERVRRLLEERKLDVRCITVNEPEDILRFGRNHKGRTIFDHSLVEETYRKAIERTENLIKRLEREGSSTRLGAQKTHPRAWIEISRWDGY